jgi:hypothetical protein
MALTVSGMGFPHQGAGLVELNFWASFPRLGQGSIDYKSSPVLFTGKDISGRQKMGRMLGYSSRKHF